MDPQLKGSLDSENIQRYPKNRRKEPETARCAYIYDMVDQVDADLKMFTLNVWMDIWLCLVAVPQWWKVWLQSGYTWQGYYWEGPLSRFLWWAFWWWSTFWRTKEFRKEGRWRWPLHRLMEEHRVWSLTRLGEGDLPSYLSTKTYLNLSGVVDPSHLQSIFVPSFLELFTFSSVFFFRFHLQSLGSLIW